ncbi:hypothetical protein [Bdellovibrio svalbardensis]|uniref:Uncharacterized protein n=1 Tax=Bdellovibrio svalbardensis TaxID=2972972 RepID=A0ABT6DLY9_9BACT|nr:hypothetical protein [Bdellovibrio svalbardensis]MDG0817085.1 hypothetical protein [Bdellovibrio svalbardensis]
MKTLIMMALTFVAVTSHAGYKFMDISAEYECQTSSVYLYSSTGKVISIEPSSKVIYKPAASENQNLVIGNHSYLVWVRQLNETDVGLSILKSSVDAAYKEINVINMGSGSEASVDLDFPINNTAGEGSAKCHITLRK